MPILLQVQHAFAHDPLRRSDRSPVGAVPVGTEVTLWLRADESVREHVYDAWLEIFGEQSGKDGSEGDATWAQVSMQPCDKGYCACVDTSGEPRILFYRFHIRTEVGDVYYGLRDDGEFTAGSAFVPNFELPEEHLPNGFQLTIYDAGFKAPRWFPGTIMYQIFPDRFARGENGIRYEGVESHKSRNWPVRIHEDWNEAPDWGEPYDPVDFFGGTLEGIEQHLDYLESLGVQVIYLNPICEARSNHRYNTGDYEQIDPILGSWDDFEQLADAARERGMRIVLDTVLSHTGTASRYFNSDGSYDSFGAMQGEDSPYRSWYEFTGSMDGVGYRCWWGDPTLPEVREWDESWQLFALGEEAAGSATDMRAGVESSGKGGVIGDWVNHGAGGIRLDVADEIPDNVLEKIRQSAKAANPESIVIGEVWEDPTTKESYGSRRTYALGRSLDSVMNYPLRDMLLQYAFGNNDAKRVETFLKLQKANYPKPLYECLMNLLSSHDVERVRSVLALGTEIRGYDRNDQLAIVSGISSEADAYGAKMQRVLATLMYMLPGVPCVYYGDERGMHGGRDPFDRATFPWDVQRGDCGVDLTMFYQRLGELRRHSAALRHGGSAFYSYGKDVILVLRSSRIDEGRNEILLCVANRSDQPQPVTVDLVDESSGLSDADCLRVRFSNESPRCLFATEGDGLAIGLPAACEFGIFNTVIGPKQACIFQLAHSLELPPGPGAGIVCHVTSVPNEDALGNNRGHGTLGEPAHRFVDALANAGIKYWQILPLNPTDEYGSPYAGLSAFAGNTRLLGDWDPDSVDEDAVEEFVTQNSEWLLPYATFAAIKATYGEVPWQEWPDEYSSWKPGLEKTPAIQAEVRREIVRQYEFERQWNELKEYANSKGIRIIGDMPIYVSADSADVWSHRNYFALDRDGKVSLQGGVPPDAFAAEGQLWGNPTYRWDVLRAHGYDWWMHRLSRVFKWYDFVRIDHFIGFCQYYAIPAGKPVNEGKWMTGPGIKFFKKAYEEFGPLPVIAEDLGNVTPEVEQLLVQTGFPGMDVVQFFDGDPQQYWQPKRGKLSFSGTHDTQTLIGWSGSAEYAADLIDKMLASDAEVVVFPLQDILGLGDEARMNVPGEAEGNWTWQASWEDIRKAAGRMRDLGRKRRSQD